MINFNAHFDGKVIVPEQAVTLPQDRSFLVHVEPHDDEESAETVGHVIDSVPSDELFRRYHELVDKRLLGHSLHRREQFEIEQIEKRLDAEE